MVGKFVQQSQEYQAFIPADFPPKSLEISHKTFLANDIATLALGKLDGIAQLVPDIQFFTTMYAKKEATLSNNIEGTKATMHDYIQAELGMANNIPADVVNIVHYNAALEHGLRHLSDLPLASRLIQEIHGILIPDSEKQSSDAGRFRESQNWIGGTRPGNADFVPPPPGELNRCLGDLDNFINENKSYPTLINVGLTHAQFETIHPFLDGNGRTGRLLITLQLCHTKTLTWPILYLSEYFKRYRQVYFDELFNYHTRGDINRWLQFFLEGVKVVADEAVQVSKDLVKLREDDRELVASLGNKQAPSATKLLLGLYKQPIVNVAEIVKITGLSPPAAYSLADKLATLGILEKIAPGKIGGSRKMHYGHGRYLRSFATD